MMHKVYRFFKNFVEAPQAMFPDWSAPAKKSLRDWKN
jgi:hypothetical protein